MMHMLASILGTSDNMLTMSNPEQLPNRQLAMVRVAELNYSLEEVRHHIVNNSRSSIMSDTDTQIREVVDQARSTVDVAKGLPIEGGLMANKYYVASEGVYEKGFLPLRHNTSNDFKGVLKGIGEVPTQGIHRILGRLCIAVDPLYTLHDEALSTYYAERGWHNQLRHPFAEEGFQDQTVYVLVDSLKPLSIKLVDEWQR